MVGNHKFPAHLHTMQCVSIQVCIPFHVHFDLEVTSSSRIFIIYCLQRYWNKSKYAYSTELNYIITGWLDEIKSYQKWAKQNSQENFAFVLNLFTSTHEIMIFHNEKLKGSMSAFYNQFTFPTSPRGSEILPTIEPLFEDRRNVFPTVRELQVPLCLFNLNLPNLLFYKKKNQINVRYSNT